MKKIFKEFNISWKFLIIFSIVLGIVVGVLNRIPFLDNTSFQDIAIVFDAWIVLAIFIIMNCKTLKEAVLKCFVFFLISQPIIYLTEIIIDTVIYGYSFSDRFILYFKNYYVGAGWLKWTILTIPGSMIAYQVKKDNILSSIILSVATMYLSYQGVKGLININFPYHLLNCILCLFMAYYLIIILLNNKKGRIIAITLTTIAIVIAIIVNVQSKKVPIIGNDMIDVGERIVEANVKDTNIATVTIDEEEGYVNVYSSTNVGTTSLKLVDEEGNEYNYTIKSTSKDFEIIKK